MKTKIPQPITNRILTLVICSVSFAALGTVWSIAISDRITLLLSLTVLVAGGLKAFTLYRSVSEANYDICEGIIISSTNIPLRKRQEIIIQGEEQEKMIIEGKHRFAIGKHYRIYLKKQDLSFENTSIPQALIPARVILGYECIK